MKPLCLAIALLALTGCLPSETTINQSLDLVV